jgi:hypothetical protein
MILSFSVGNYRSFREVQTLNLTATKKKSRFSYQDENIVKLNENDAGLKVNVVYGPNASGKSNLISAMLDFLYICRGSLASKSPLKEIIPFLLDGTSRLEPSFFEIVIFHNGTTFRYGFEADIERIHSEWLFLESEGTETMYFERTGADVKFNESVFAEGEKIVQGLGTKASTLDDDKLLYSIGVLLKSDVLVRLQKAFSSIIITDNPLGDDMRELALDLLQNADTRRATVRLLNNLGVSVEAILHADAPEDQKAMGKSADALRDVKDHKIIFSHSFSDQDTGKPNIAGWFMDVMESAGTQRLVLLAPFIIATIKTGGILIIDEFEARLHTNLSRAIVETFIEPDSNPNNAQLIVATHDTNLLAANLLRRDQITFVQKQEDKSSEIFRLSDLKNVRSDRSFEKDYLSGRYEAIPDVDRLIIDHATK